MPTKYPERPYQHNLETISERFFNAALPQNWISHKPSGDYGVDLRVEIFEDGLARGLELLVQLKSSRRPTNGATETIRLDVSTYNHLWDKLQVVLLVKFVEEVSEAYWLLLSDVPEPNQDKTSFTIHIPKEHTLSTIDWNDIHEYVRQVTYEKLTVRRRNRRNA